MSLAPDSRFGLETSDRMLAQLRRNGVLVEKIEDYDYGRFAWIYRPRRQSRRVVGAKKQMKASPGKIGRAKSRLPAPPLNDGRQLVSTFWSPPPDSAAMAHVGCCAASRSRRRLW
jgi:hypothetical protein